MLVHPPLDVTGRAGTSGITTSAGSWTASTGFRRFMYVERGRFVGEDVPLRERLLVHDVRLDEVREEAPVRTVGEDTELHACLLRKVVAKLLVVAKQLLADLAGTREDR